MKASGSQRDGFILGMTLAEIFLLLLLIVWWASKIESDASGTTSPRVTEANLRAENSQLRKRLEDLEAGNRTLEQQNKTLRQLFGVDPDKFTQDPAGEGKRARDAILRGKPQCAEDNLLAEVTVIDGAVEMRVLAPPSVAARFAPEARSTAESPALASSEAVDRTLSGIAQYYRERRDSGSDCRFDYRLIYSTDSDYRYGRERFETVFYPAGGIRRAVPDGR